MSHNRVRRFYSDVVRSSRLDGTDGLFQMVGHLVGHLVDRVPAAGNDGQQLKEFVGHPVVAGDRGGEPAYCRARPYPSPPSRSGEAVRRAPSAGDRFGASHRRIVTIPG